MPGEGLNEAGGNLIFIVCQPRSGSTLLQNMLRGHPRIHTLPEPWFMLHLLYGWRSDGLTAEYDARIAHSALVGYLSATGRGKDLYIEAIRAAAVRLYDAALAPSGKRFFLDKTPRYYLIVDELREVFANARFIFLVRNPLAVLASILHQLDGDWTALRQPDRMHDLVTAPRNIVRATDMPHDRWTLVRYEDLVHDPDETLSRMLRELDIDEVRGLTTYRAIESTLGDTKSVRKHSAPVDDYIDRWRRDLSESDKSDLARSYLNELGEVVLDGLGYSYRELSDQIGPKRRRGTSNRWTLLLTPDNELCWWDRMRLSFIHSVHQRGIWKTILRDAYIVVVGRLSGRHDS
jgi:hypothetical protein